MKFILISVTAVFAFSGCASFGTAPSHSKRQFENSRKCAQGLVPAASLKISWWQFKPVNAAQELKDGFYQSKRTAVIVSDEDIDMLNSAVAQAYSRAGIYDPQKGSGELSVTLTSHNRGTFGDILRGPLTDTPYVFIWPASYGVGHELVVQGFMGEVVVNTKSEGAITTWMHALLFPLAPFTRYSSREKAVIRDLLADSVYQIYGAQCRRPVESAVP